MIEQLKKLIICLVLPFSLGSALAQEEEVIDVQFKHTVGDDSDSSRTLRSLVRLRDISEQYSTGGLYLMTHYGDREELFQKENEKLLDDPWINQTWRYCSIFSTRRTNRSVLMGRNWDNQNVGSIIVSLYKPARGFASISFSRAIDMGFPLNIRLESMVSNPFGGKLLYAPFYAFDGMNEQGVCAGIAGLAHSRVQSREGGEPTFITFLVRKILDQTRTIEEAVSLVETHDPFDLERNSLNAHLYVVDSTGRSVVLEYVNDHWEETYTTNLWQVMTTKKVYGVSDSTLRKQCWRYRSLAEALEASEGTVDWRAGMRMLRDVSQKGTTWSVVYSPSAKDLHFSVYQNWDRVYHLQGF